LTDGSGGAFALRLKPSILILLFFFVELSADSGAPWMIDPEFLHLRN
jgi:hypothetical protein